MLGGQKGHLKVRDNHLTASVTSRDLMGVSRGRCLGCASCGKYIIYTKEKYYRKGEDATVHPDCDPSIMNCSRCSCAADQHEVDVAATERECGNDAVAVGDYDSAIVHYSKALEVNPVDSKIWSNRSKCYCAKHWWSQALYDANRGASLDPGWYKIHYRKAIALKGLGRSQEALDACTTALSCLEKENDPSSDDAQAIQELIRDLKSKIRVQNHGKGESRRRKVSYQQDDENSMPESKSGRDQKPVDYSVKKELELIRSSIESMQGKLNFISEWITQHAPTDVHREDLVNICGRLDRVESQLHSTQECVPSESDEEAKTVDEDTLSRTSSSMSNLSDEIAMIENAWKMKLDVSGTISDASESDSEAHDTNQTHEDRDESSPSSQDSLQVSDRSLNERKKRVLDAKERREKAEKAGEPMMTTSQDMLTQTKRMGCKTCGPSCPEFKIYYQNEDVHNPEVMFYCSECGCRSEDHEIDQEYEKARQQKAAMEEQQARMRAARMKSRTYEGHSKIQEAHATLGVQLGCSMDEIKRAYRALAKRYHPDKQQKGYTREQDIVRRQQMFTKSTEAYRYLVEHLG